MFDQFQRIGYDRISGRFYDVKYRYFLNGTPILNVGVIFVNYYSILELTNNFFLKLDATNLLHNPQPETHCSLHFLAHIL
jgi:hypothetical protein